jgi:xanthine dehydrogenase accessory factor
MAGSVSGGCVEADVYERAIQVLDSGKPVVVSYGIADELAFQVGLSCGGSIEVLIEPFVPDNTWEALCHAVKGQQPVAFAIGLAPDQLLGRKLTVLDEGKSTGSIAPALDGQIACEGRRLLQAGGTQVLNLAYQGGEAKAFMEGFPPSPSLFIVGATHTAIPLCRMAREVGFRVTVIDARSVLATQERFPDADQLVRLWADEFLDQLPLGQHSFVVVLTHDPKFDIPTLACALRSQAGYIGVLGGRVTHEQREAKLRQQGFTEADLARIRSPIGLDIGSRTPEELAVAILAEMLAVRYGRGGRLLKV